MTNSRLTDPEILETRLPVRLDEFAIRRGSGGQGAHHGGDGVIREVTFLEPMRANILANRRRVAPRGLAGGGDAQPGRNWVERTDGSIENAERDRLGRRRARRPLRHRNAGRRRVWEGAANDQLLAAARDRCWSSSASRCGSTRCWWSRSRRSSPACSAGWTSSRSRDPRQGFNDNRYHRPSSTSSCRSSACSNATDCSSARER